VPASDSEDPPEPGSYSTNAFDSPFSSSELRRIVGQRYGEMLHVGGAAASDTEQRRIERCLLHAALIPQQLVMRLRDAGLSGVFVGVGTAPDLDELDYLRDLQPDGWSPGTTYANVPAVYVRRRGIVAVGVGGHPLATMSALLHEMGHACGDLLGLNDAPDLFLGHVRLAEQQRLPMFAQPAGDPRARRELLAELFAVRMLSRDDALRAFDGQLVTWLESALGII
jgi:hypothetical protein